MTKLQKFIFFISALIPGAGHMYLGFMKRGLLLMTIYFVNIGLSMILNGFLVFMPVIWFYCLFDAWNKFYLSDSERKNVDDSFIFFYNAIPEELLPKSKRFSNKIPQKFYRVLGEVVIFFGIVMLCHEVRENLELPELASRILSFVPELLVSLALIALGIKLIIHKKKEVFSEHDFNSSIPSASDDEVILDCAKGDSLDDISFNAYDENDEYEDAGFNSAPNSSDDIKDNSISNMSEDAKKIDSISSDILNDLDSALTPLEDSLNASNVHDKEIEYIWSSPVKTDDNPQ